MMGEEEMAEDNKSYRKLWNKEMMNLMGIFGNI